MEKTEMLQYAPIAVMFILALGFVVTTMIVTHALGPKRKSKIKSDSFECGIEPQGNARVPFSIKYFLVAILFVLFDVEVIFMYPWAVNFKDLGTTGFIEMVVFIGLLLVGFFYLIKKRRTELGGLNAKYGKGSESKCHGQHRRKARRN